MFLACSSARPRPDKLSDAGWPPAHRASQPHTLPCVSMHGHHCFNLAAPAVVHRAASCVDSRKSAVEVAGKMAQPC